MELRQIIDQVKKLDFEAKSTSNELARVQHAFEAKMEDVTGSGQVARYKQQILKLKQQTRTFARNEGVMLSRLFSCGGMRHGAHHLYDGLEPHEPARGGARPTQRHHTTNNDDEALRDEDFD